MHYTNVDAAYEIISGKKLRFTSAKNTNDPSEFEFGATVVERALDICIGRLTGPDKQLVQAALNNFRYRQFTAFIFCACEADDDEWDVGELSQWRLYGADGHGVAFALDLTANGHLGIPRKVLYGESAGVEFACAEIDRFVAFLNSAPPRLLVGPDPRIPIPHNEYLLNMLFWVPAVIKHRAYRHEREVRLVRGDLHNQSAYEMKFVGKGIRKPVVDLPLYVWRGNEAHKYPVGPLRHLIAGPSADQRALEDSLAHFMTLHKAVYPVKRSDIPYRSVAPAAR